MLVAIVNGLIDIVTLAMSALILLLPESPFKFDTLDWGPFGDLIGLILPVGPMAASLTIILSAFSVYYVVRWALRLIRQIN